jgi:biotin carboxylase
VNVLVLYPGGLSQRQRLAALAPSLGRDHGIHLILAEDEPASAEGFHSVWPLPPAQEVGAVLAACERAARGIPIAAVLALSETALLPGACLAQRLGLPGLAPEAALACASKLATRESLQAAKVPTPRFRLVDDASAVRRFAADGPFPVYLKAVASTLGRLVARVNREVEIDDAVDRLRIGLQRSADVRRLSSFAQAAGLDLGCDPTRQFLVEAAASGLSVETDGVLTRDAQHCLGVTEQVWSPAPRLYIEGYLRPAEPSAVAPALATSNAALAALGLRSCGYSVEMRVAQGTAQVIEVNGRLGEDDGLPDLFVHAAGVDPVRLALEAALGDEGARPPASADGWALAYRSWYRGGLVTRVPTPAELRAARAEATALGVPVEVGDRLPAAPDPDLFPHIAWVLARDPCSSRHALRRARAVAESLRFAFE